MKTAALNKIHNILMACGISIGVALGLIYCLLQMP